MNSILNAALAYAERGWAVFPLSKNSKIPLKNSTGFKAASTDTDTIMRLFANPSLNIGAATGMVSGLIVIDLDVKEGAKGMESVKILRGLLPTLMAKTPTGGYHYFYALSRPLRGTTGLLPGIDVKADGGYIVLPPTSINDIKYEWINDSPIVSLSAELHAQILELCAKNKKADVNFDDEGKIPLHHRNNYLTKIAGRYRRAGLTSEDMMPLLKKINAQKLAEPLPDADVETICRSVGRYAPEHGRDFSESGIADEFTKRHGDNLRYVSEWGQWLQWQENIWKTENTLACYDLARTICMETAEFSKKESERKRILSAQTVAAIERMARSDRVHAAVTDQWDRDIWSLNTPGGMLDLKTGILRAAEKSDYSTKITRGRLADCAGLKWHSFLDVVTNNNESLKSYLKRISGYALTGVTYEQALFFFYGSGGNGKSAFLEIIAGAIGDYALTSPASTFMASETEKHPADIAILKGARLVTATEIEKNQRWSESRIKSLTGGDTISARLMRQDYFQFKPQFKLFISGNNKPQISDVDEAIKRRLFLIPFMEVISNVNRIKDLSNIIIEEESDAVLQWMIEGCLEWQKQGLDTPQEVKDATTDYLETEDSLSRWIEEECILANNARGLAGVLFNSWKIWAEKNREYIGSQKQFSQLLKKRGFVSKRMGDGWKFTGIALKGSEVQSEFENVN